MNTITQIENALKAINQAVFQNLINHLLHLEGNKYIGAPGAVVGKEKTSKGTPDSFYFDDEKYIFVECTTKEKLGNSNSFLDKLSSDVEHCFNEVDTKISSDKIKKVILACTEKISTNEHNFLNTKVKSYNSDTKFEILNIQNLPFRILDIPKLAEDYLNIQIIKGDIFTLEQFLFKTTKGLQPSLRNEFIGREEELKKSTEALRLHEILLLSGGAGVGKSKLAVKILEELSKENYIPIVIQSSAVSLWDDYKHLFLPKRKYIILFDDANKSITNLNYLLSKLDVAKVYSAKLIITSRDYVKKQVSFALNNHTYKEISISEFKDEAIEKIIVSALPNLENHHGIKQKIIQLAKGNARVALMATYSVTPDSENNYLNSPVLLYEKYFKKITEDIGIFNSPIILQSLAVVAFFGVLDRNNEELKDLLSDHFGIDWNELWTAILELHNSEILDVYSDEVVRVTDQVLATYSFYKCFVDDNSAVIKYSDWIFTFLEKFAHRISSTLIDANNTFGYYHVKVLILPHLEEVSNKIQSEKEIYAFYKLFWFYKGLDCLLYLRKWINTLPQQQLTKTIKFTYRHNDHTIPTKHFELLKGFWNHSNELLKPSLELTLALIINEPNRLPEILKFLCEDFKYRIEDLENGFLRQNILLDVLLDDKLDITQKPFAKGIFLNVAKELMGWHYTEFGSTKGQAFTIYNFNLNKSNALMMLRKRILTQVYVLFEFENEMHEKILNKLIYPGGDIDKSIYIDELPNYQKIISRNLDTKKYVHCKFVKNLAKKITQAGIEYPKNWNDFIESDISKLSGFLKPNWEYRDSKSIDESQKEKRQEFDDFVKANDWQTIERFFFSVDDLYSQVKENDGWSIESAVTDIFISLLRKDKGEFVHALRLYFSGRVHFSLNTSILNIAMHESIMTGKEFLKIINQYEFQTKPYWISYLLTNLPEEQVEESFLKILLKSFKNSEEYIYINRMITYLKYQKIFDKYKKEKPELENHNLITYLTKLLLNKKSKTRYDFGFHFCADCALYFGRHSSLLKDAYWSQFMVDSHFDSDGQELKAILDLDKTFIIESLKEGIIGLEYSSKIRLEKIYTSILWDYNEYEKMVEDILLVILDKVKFSSISNRDIFSLFRSKNNNIDSLQKIKSLIKKLTHKYFSNETIVLPLIEVVYTNYNEWFVDYFRDFLTLNSDISITKKISFDIRSSTTGSWVPVYQKKIEFYQHILIMIKSFPNILDYSEHIVYFEQRISWKKKEIEKQQKRDFIDEFY